MNTYETITYNLTNHDGIKHGCFKEQDHEVSI